MIFVGFFAIAYLAMFVVTIIYAKRAGRSSLWWLLVSLMLTPFIAFILLRGGELQKQRVIKR
jgi:hypothetical protein